jgi:cbb3-type cytochrome oxidase maturation protein
MSVVYILLPAAALLAAAGVAAFIWAVRRGQFDDLDTPAVRILHDDEDESPAPQPNLRRPETQRR